MNSAVSHDVGVDVTPTLPSEFQPAVTDVSSSLGRSPWKMIPIPIASASASQLATPSIVHEQHDHRIELELGSLGPFSLSFAIDESESCLFEASDSLAPAAAPAAAVAAAAGVDVKVLASFDTPPRPDDDSRRRRRRRRFPPPPAPGDLPTLEQAEQTPQSCRRRQTLAANRRLDAPTIQSRSRSTSGVIDHDEDHATIDPFDSPCPSGSNLIDVSDDYPAQAAQVDNEDEDEDDPANLIDQMMSMLDVGRGRGPVPVRYWGVPGSKNSENPEEKEQEEQEEQE